MSGDDHTDVIRDLERLARRQRCELDETLTRIDNLRAQHDVEDLSPEERRAKIREWTRRLGGASAIAAAIAALRWLRNRPGEAATVAAMAALSTTLAILAPRIDEPEPIPETQHPLPWEVMPAIDGRVYPEAAVTAAIETPEPDDPEPSPALADPGGAPPGDSDVAPEPEPQPELLGMPEPESEPTAPPPEPEPESDPTPTPEPAPTELADDEDEARELCLDLDTRPVTDLGLCIRELLGLLEAESLTEP